MINIMLWAIFGFSLGYYFYYAHQFKRDSKEVKEILDYLESQTDTLKYSSELSNLMTTEYRRNPNSEKIYHALAMYEQSREETKKARLKVVR